MVYHIPCTDCNQVYIGETARKFGVRRAEHKKEADQLEKAHFTRSQKKQADTTINKSALSDHVAQNNHTINWKGSKIVARDSNKFTRWIREAIHIQKETGHSMNRDMGQYKLSPTYVPILSDNNAGIPPSHHRPEASGIQSEEAHC